MPPNVDTAHSQTVICNLEKMNKLEIYLTVGVAIWVISCALIVLNLLNSILPDNAIIESKTSKKKLSIFSKLYEKIKTDPVALSIFLFGIALSVFLVLIKVQRVKLESFIEGIQVEIFGILFDIILLVLLANWLNKKGEKKRRIEENENEIEDFRTWHSEEAKFRIIGSIKRLNRDNQYKINLTRVFLNGRSQPGGNSDLTNLNLTKSIFSKTEGQYCNFSNTMMDGIQDHYSNFNNSTFIRTSIKDAHLQGTNFKHAYLNDTKFNNSVITAQVNFDNAKLLNPDFTNAEFNSASFNNTEVSSNFAEELVKWQIRGKKVFDDYIMIEHSITGNPNAKIWVLQKPTQLTPYLTSPHIILKDIEY